MLRKELEKLGRTPGKNYEPIQSVEGVKPVQQVSEVGPVPGVPGIQSLGGMPTSTLKNSLLPDNPMYQPTTTQVPGPAMEKDAMSQDGLREHLQRLGKYQEQRRAKFSDRSQY